MRQSLRFFALVLGAMAGLGFARTASATCDLPLAIGGAAAQANVLIILDNSGSMNEALTSSSYNPNTKYTGKFTAGTTYNINTSGTYTPHGVKNTITDTTPSAYLVTSDGGQSGQYRRQLPELDLLPRHRRADRGDSGGHANPVRQVGGELGARTVSGCQFRPRSLRHQQEWQGCSRNIRHRRQPPFRPPWPGFRATTATPLAGALNHRDAILSRPPVRPARHPVELPEELRHHRDRRSCRRSDMTSAAYCTDVDHDGSLLDDVANYMYKNDMRADMTGLQNVATFTIGLQRRRQPAAEDRDQGRRRYFSISDGAGLINALNADFNIDRGARRGRHGGLGGPVRRPHQQPALPRPLPVADLARLRGSLRAPVHAGDSAAVGGRLADARRMNPDSRTRHARRRTGTDTYQFTAANCVDAQTLLGAAQDTTAKNVINYIRGKSFSRVPRSLAAGSSATSSTPHRSASAIRTLQQLPQLLRRSARPARAAPEMVYVAANDGHVHCFNATNGAENWAYVPKTTLPQLNALMRPGLLSPVLPQHDAGRLRHLHRRRLEDGR